MLLVGKSHVDEVKFEDSNTITYHELETDDQWKIEPIREIIEAKAGNIEIPGFSNEELDDILLYLCTSQEASFSSSSSSEVFSGYPCSSINKWSYPYIVT